MSESFMEKLERMWPTHGRMSREDYQLSFKARWKSRWRFFRRLGLRRALRHPLQFKHQMWVCTIDVLKYQDCVRRRNEYLDLFECRREPFYTDSTPYKTELWMSVPKFEPMVKQTASTKSPGGAKQASPEAPAPVQQEKSDGQENRQAG